MDSDDNRNVHVKVVMDRLEDRKDVEDRKGVRDVIPTTLVVKEIITRAGTFPRLNPGDTLALELELDAACRAIQSSPEEIARLILERPREILFMIPEIRERMRLEKAAEAEKRAESSFDEWNW